MHDAKNASEKIVRAFMVESNYEYCVRQVVYKTGRDNLKNLQF